jgi:curli biogenesis system outer membrane secretion channel CsgG
MKQLLLFITSFIVSHLAFGQKNVTTTFETIKAQCQNLPADKRVRLTVARFSVTASTAPSEFGGNLAIMLTNALQAVNCYTVLESLKNKEDMNNEIDYGEGGYAKKSTVAKKGKQLSAQVVVTGEVTEYNSKNSGVRVGVIKVGSNKAKIGFVLKIINPETRVVLYSQSINTEAKIGGATEFGAFGVNVVSAIANDPALANACEQGIIKAVEFLASKKDSLNLIGVVNSATDINAINETEVTLTEANFNSFNAFTTLLHSVRSYKSVEKSLKSGIATYTVSHTGSSNTFLEELNKKMGTKYEVTGFEDGKIELKAKQ